MIQWQYRHKRSPYYMTSMSLIRRLPWRGKLLNVYWQIVSGKLIGFTVALAATSNKSIAKPLSFVWFSSHLSHPISTLFFRIYITPWSKPFLALERGWYAEKGKLKEAGCIRLLYGGESQTSYRTFYRLALERKRRLWGGRMKEAWLGGDLTAGGALLALIFPAFPGCSAAGVNKRSWQRTKKWTFPEGGEARRGSGETLTPEIYPRHHQPPLP